MRYLTILLALCAAILTGAPQSNAQGIDPVADSIAVVRMRERMAEVRKERPTVALVLGG